MSQATVLTTTGFEELKNTTGLYLIDFWAEWCPPCKAMSPIIDGLSADAELSSVKFLKCDVDNEGQLAEFFNVSSIPTFYLIKTTGDGQFDLKTHVVAKFVGAQPAFDFKLNLLKALAPQEVTA